MRNHLYSTLVAALALSVAACAGEITSTGDDDGSGSGSDEPVTCQAARAYTDIGGTALGADRPTIEPGTDRIRIKPYAALAAEYKAALGLTTAFDTSAFAPTFGKPPARWFAEPQASANTIYAAFALAYDGCTQKMATDGQYAAAPSQMAAEVVCHDLVRRAWHREATAAETTSCVDYAVNQTVTSDPPRTRWAYTCAAVLSASGFLAY